MNVRLEENGELPATKPGVSRRRRSWHDILLRILKTAQKGERKTRMMKAVGMSYSQLMRYLSALKEADFISEKSGVWKTTKKGFHVIEACEICQRLVEEVS